MDGRGESDGNGPFDRVRCQAANSAAHHHGRPNSARLLRRQQRINYIDVDEMLSTHRGGAHSYWRVVKLLMKSRPARDEVKTFDFINLFLLIHRVL